ncbi:MULTISPECIES: primosomal protein DnaI [Bacillaceae]|jgi:primosomal protein DnaI|uniref:primosomal protein DnaI n=1 Tax=Bacillaceae TaxID=186817 RepID=UPI000BF86958|nr:MULTISPECIES: primosomal protein DnaI [Bacillaceae]PEZ83661.1 primosomal protein DnaI [Bacillus sp. AFS017274]
MEKINRSLNKLANTNQFQQRYEKLKQEIFEDEQVRLFLNANSSTVTKEMIDKNLGKLYEFTSQSNKCDKCPSLNGCINMMQGYYPKLVVQGKALNLNYEICPRKLAEDEKRKREKLIRSLYVPKDILRATIEDFTQTDNENKRLGVLSKAMSFIMEYEPGKMQKGLYIYGKFGVGKTYLLGAIANELAERQISSLIVYVPDYLRELKGSIGDNTVNEKIEMVKTAPVLMLDDIGAESMTSWGRDEVFGPILQFRMLENLPTFFTSNFDLNGLENHLTFSQRGEKEEVKAARIMERIQYLAEPVKLDGLNRRR